MYIFELITRLIKGKKFVRHNLYSPVSENPDGLVENSENCEHLFLPLDSSNTIFACKYCGLIASKEQLKNKNIFENKSEFKNYPHS